MIAEVIVDITNSELDRIFDYDTGDLSVDAGYRVSVPFGNRKIEGIVIGLKQSSDLPKEKIKSILSVSDDFPALTKESLKLVDYISGRFKVSKALAMRLFLPSEMRRGQVAEKTVEFLFVPQTGTLDDA